MKKPKLTKKQRDGILRWLSLEKGSADFSCPFPQCYPDGCGICMYYFKRSEKAHYEDESRCPCGYYSHAYVVRVAKKILKERGAI